MKNLLKLKEARTKVDKMTQTIWYTLREDDYRRWSPLVFK